jgi:hypothetical protein
MKCQILLEKSETPVKDLDIEGRILLTWILKKSEEDMD